MQPNDLFEITWGGMGYEMSVFRKLGKIRQQTNINDLLEIDAKREVYVAFRQDGQQDEYLEVGYLFKKDSPIEKIALPPQDHSGGYLNWPRAAIKGDKIMVCFDRVVEGEEKIENLVFNPKMLK